MIFDAVTYFLQFISFVAVAISFSVNHSHRVQLRSGQQVCYIIAGGCKMLKNRTKFFRWKNGQKKELHFSVDYFSFTTGSTHFL